MTFREFDQYKGIAFEWRFAGPEGPCSSFSVGGDNVLIGAYPNNDYPGYLEGHYRHWTGTEWVHMPNDPDYPVGTGQLISCTS